MIRQTIHKPTGSMSDLHERIAHVASSVFAFPGGARAHIFGGSLHPETEKKLVVVGDKKAAVSKDLAKGHVSHYALVVRSPARAIGRTSESGVRIPFKDGVDACEVAEQRCEKTDHKVATS